MKLDEFLSQAVTDCVEVGSGSAYAAGIRSEVPDVNEGRIHTVRLLYRPCHGCEREHHVKNLVDDLCPRCRGENDEDALRARMHEAARQGHRNAARLLHRIGQHDRARIHEEWADRE